jgi:sugar phosphate isomerase/epimerase
MWPAIGLCWGTVRQASLGELIDVAGTYRFPTISVPPHIVDLYLDSGATFAGLRRHLAGAGVRVTVIDALTRDLPGAPSPDEVPPIWRQNWTYALDDLIRMAEALEAPTVNVTHFLGKQVEPQVMAEAIAALAERAGRHGLSLSLEFMPETSLATVASSARIVQLCGAPNVGLMVDIWHLLRAGGDAGDIRMLPAGFVKGVQLNDRRADALQPSRGEVSSRSLPGEGDAPLAELMQAILDNTPGVSIEVEVFSPELAALSPAAAGERVARALARWQRTLGDAVRPRSLGCLDA